MNELRVYTVFAGKGFSQVSFLLCIIKKKKLFQTVKQGKEPHFNTVL